MLVFMVIDPFEIPIWGDRAFLIYMTQVVYRGQDLYENTPFGYTPLTQLIAGNLLLAFEKIVDTLDVIATLRVMGMALHACITASIFYLGKQIFERELPAHLTALFFLSIGYYLSIGAIDFEPKFLALFFEVWGIYCVVKRKYFYSGLWFSLAAMCWQPMVLNCLMMIPLLFVLQKDLKSVLSNFVWLSLGVFVGTLPVLLYLFVTDDWSDFWNLAVVRKIGVEGAELFSDPLMWIRNAVRTELGTEKLFFLMGFAGFAWALLELFKVKWFNRELFNRLDWITIMILMTGWGLFNTLEYQGVMDLVPIIPFVLLFAAFFVDRLLEKFAKGYVKYIAISVLVIYGLYDTLIPADYTTYSDQQRMIEEINETYGDIVPINFEEYYVLQNKPMPTRYMRFANYEDFVIDLIQENGCKDVLDDFRRIKPKAIVAKVSIANRPGSTGKCGQALIDTFSNGRKKEISVNLGRLNPSSNKMIKRVFEIHETTFLEE